MFYRIKSVEELRADPYVYKYNNLFIHKVHDNSIPFGKDGNMAGEILTSQGLTLSRNNIWNVENWMIAETIDMTEDELREHYPEYFI